MSYMLADLDAAERAIIASVPNAHIDRFGDFGWKMVAIRPDNSGAIIVFQPQWDEQGQTEIITPIQDVISFLRPS